jgi:hypothetical protein
MKKSGLTGMLVMLVACYPGDVSSIAELDVVMTRYATDYNFGQVTRFTMPDTIIHVNTDEPDAILIPRAPTTSRPWIGSVPIWSPRAGQRSIGTTPLGVTPWT